VVTAEASAPVWLRLSARVRASRIRRVAGCDAGLGEDGSGGGVTALSERAQANKEGIKGMPRS
jgi:hypothetical protein